METRETASKGRALPPRQPELRKSVGLANRRREREGSWVLPQLLLLTPPPTAEFLLSNETDGTKRGGRGREKNVQLIAILLS